MGKLMSYGAVLAILFAFTAMAYTPTASAQALSSAQTIPEREGVWGDIVYGNPEARVELIEYGSLTCPHCASFSADVLPRLQADFLEAGKLRFVFRNFVRDRYDLTAAAASRCLSSVDATKRTLTVLFREQPLWMRAENPYVAIAEIVSREGLDQAGFSACVSEQSVREHVIEMTQNGAKLYDIKAIPTLVLNGTPFTFEGYDALKNRIDEAIAATSE